MIQETLTCAKCGSNALRKNGSSKGKAKYLCTNCRHQAVFTHAVPIRIYLYAQVEKLLIERIPQRTIVKMTGISRTTVSKLAKKIHKAL